MKQKQRHLKKWNAQWPGLPSFLVYSINFVDHYYKMHFGTACGPGYWSAPHMQSHGLYAVAGPPTTANEQSISFRCLWAKLNEQSQKLNLIFIVLDQLQLVLWMSSGSGDLVNQGWVGSGIALTPDDAGIAPVKQFEAFF